MTIEELYYQLKKIGVSEDKYYLNGYYGSSDDNEKFALVKKRGAYFTEYEFYIKEKGEKHSIKIFTNEDEAYLYFYKRLKENKEIEDRYFK